MHSSVYVARPMKVQRFGATSPGIPSPMRIDLRDPYLLLDYLTKLHNSLLYEDIRLDAVIFGVVDYFSLVELANTRITWSAEKVNGCFAINGVKILLDPMREGGAPVSVFTESEAIKVMSMRRKS